MGLINVTGPRDITLLCVAVTLVVLALVAVIRLPSLPRDEWLRQVLLHSPMVTLLAYGSVRIIGQQMPRTQSWPRNFDAS